MGLLAGLPCHFMGGRPLSVAGFTTAMCWGKGSKKATVRAQLADCGPGEAWECEAWSALLG